MRRIALMIFVACFLLFFGTTAVFADVQPATDQEQTANLESVKEYCAETTEQLLAQKPANTASVCLAHEQFDAQKNKCVEQCQIQKNCDARDSTISDITKQLLAFKSSNKPAAADFYADTPLRIIAYDVIRLRLRNPEPNKSFIRLAPYRKNKRVLVKIWTDLRTLFPEQYIRQIGKFVLFADGIDGTEAETIRDPNAPEQLIFSFDPADIGDEFFILIHEFAHILALSAHEDAVGSLYSECSGLDFAGKELQRDSYLNEFRKQFWDRLDERFQALATLPDGAKRDTLVEELGQKYGNHFLTDYALQSPEEYFAESFAIFVLAESPTQSEPAYDKIRFFYDFPELTRLRDSIRWQLQVINQ